MEAGELSGDTGGEAGVVGRHQAHRHHGRPGEAARRDIAPTAASLPPEQLRVDDPGLVNHVTRWIAEKAMNARAGIPIDAPTAEAEAAALMLRALLIELDHATAREAEGPRPIALAGWRRLTSWMQDHLYDLPPVDELARRAGYSRSHFSRAFRTQTGLSPQQYIVNARIALAKELLRSTGLAITEVALRAGYADIFTFSRQFKQRTGITPSGYRAQGTA